VSSWLEPVARYVGHGALLTVLLAASTVAVTLVVGVICGALLTLPSGWIVRAPLIAYVQLWRALPVLVTLFVVFFSLPVLGIHLGSFLAALVGLSLWGSANVAEVVRGAVRSIPIGQSEAAAALGFGWGRRLQYVILPQAMRRMLPPLVGLLVDLIQATTLASLVGVAEILQTGQQSVERLTLSGGDSHAIPIFGGVLLAFFVICYPFTLLARYLEHRLVRRDSRLGGGQRIFRRRAPVTSAAPAAP